MANIKSQIKRNRTNEERRKRNQSVKSSLHTAVRGFRAAIDAGDKDKAGELSETHGDQIEEHSDTGLDTAGEFAEGKGAGSEHVDKGKDFLDGKIGE